MGDQAGTTEQERKRDAGAQGGLRALTVIAFDSWRTCDVPMRPSPGVFVSINHRQTPVADDESAFHEEEVMSRTQSASRFGLELFRGGVGIDRAEGALILLHGRGGSAEDILALGAELRLQNVSLLAPEAAGHSWYPNSFLAPLEKNEPWITSALQALAELVGECEDGGIAADRIALLGFSQGACLACEFVARYPRRYAAVVAFTGGLLGPPGSDLRHSGSLEGTPVLLSSGDPDPHVPWLRVDETAEEFIRMEAAVQMMRHRDRPHTIAADEVDAACDLLAPLLTRPALLAAEGR